MIKEGNGKSGVLYLVATPIGNLEDMTFRAVRILNEVDLIAAEDTRTSGVLLSHYDIHTPVTAYHEHNKLEKIPVLLAKMLEGQSIAVITDAGTPGISDPGEELVAACANEGIDVFGIPGAVAAVTALVSSGISSRRFAFEAFLPKKKKLRQQVLSELKRETRTILIYEAPHHLKDTIKELAEVLGEERRLAFCRELTKKFEEKRTLTLGEALIYFTANEPRGEYVLVIEGRSRDSIADEEKNVWEDVAITDHYEQYIKEGFDRKSAMQKVAQDRGMSKNEVYAVLKKA